MCKYVLALPLSSTSLLHVGRRAGKIQNAWLRFVRTLVGLSVYEIGNNTGLYPWNYNISCPKDA